MQPMTASKSETQDTAVTRWQAPRGLSQRCTAVLMCHAHVSSSPCWKACTAHLPTSSVSRANSSTSCGGASHVDSMSVMPASDGQPTGLAGCNRHNQSTAVVKAVHIRKKLTAIMQQHFRSIVIHQQSR
jgi:hypothetical protein